jgi:Leucine-rich repeat (LRR) protein
MFKKRAPFTIETKLFNQKSTKKVSNRIWSMNVDKADKSNDTSLVDDDCKWWDHVNLTKLILASNKITNIPKEAALLDSLVTLDVNTPNLTHLISF